MLYLAAFCDSWILMFVRSIARGVISALFALHSTIDYVLHSCSKHEILTPKVTRQHREAWGGAAAWAMAHPKFWLDGPQCIWPHQYLACMFVSSSSVKLVTKQIYVAITDSCRFCDKFPAERIIACISKSKPLFTEFYTHHTMISVCPQSQCCSL